MLTQVFEGDPIVYDPYTKGVGPRLGLGSYFRITGLLPVGEATVHSNNILMGFHVNWANTLIFTQSFASRWDASTGQWLGKVPIADSTFSGLALGNCTLSSLGKPYWNYNQELFYGYSLQEFSPWTLSSTGSPLVLAQDYYHNWVASWSIPAYDDASGIIMDGSGPTLRVWEVSSKKQLYQWYAPSDIVAVALGGPRRVYILCDNRVLVLFDYVAQEILGVVKIPNPSSRNPLTKLGSLFTVAMSWDAARSRLLLWEQVPDRPDGTSSTVIRGYRMVPQAIRLTTPLPLQAPKVGRVIPVLVQLVGDLNEGIGGVLLNGSVSGGGNLLTPGVVTDQSGYGVFQIRCLQPTPIQMTVFANLFGATVAVKWNEPDRTLGGHPIRGNPFFQPTDG